MINENAQVQEAMSYLAYGAVKSLIQPAADNKARQKFTGKELDEDGKIVDGQGGIVCAGMMLNYFGARYYDSDIGLWTSTDPKREFWSPYRYTTNPIGFIDLSGLAEKVAIISAKAFEGVSDNAIENHITNPFRSLKTSYTEKGSSFDYYLNFSKLYLEIALKDNPDMKDLYVLGHGIIGGNGMLDDNGESVDASVFNDIFKDKGITVHIYACSQKNAKWEGNFDLSGSPSGGKYAHELLPTLKSDLQKNLNSTGAGEEKK